MSEFRDLTGIHRAKLRHVAFSETLKGKEQILLKFELLEQASGNPTGTTLTYFGQFEGKSLDFTVDAIRCCGWVGDELHELPDLALNNRLDEEVSLTVERDEYEGNVSNRVKYVNRPGRFGKPMSPEMVRELSARLKNAVKNSTRSKKPGASSNRFDDVPLPEEDIPF